MMSKCCSKNLIEIRQMGAAIFFLLTLLICITLKTVKWIDLLKYLCYQHQNWNMASGDWDSNLFYQWAWLVKKHGHRQAKYPCKGWGLANIVPKSLTIFPIDMKLGWHHHILEYTHENILSSSLRGRLQAHVAVYMSECEKPYTPLAPRASGVYLNFNFNWFC